MTRSNARFWVLLTAALVVVVVLIGGAGGDGPPLDPRSVNPDGAKGLVETLERVGARVDLDAALPEPGATTALLLQDRLSNEDTSALQEWVRAGGVLVVADVRSSLSAPPVSQVDQLDVAASGPNRNVCTIAALVEVRQLPVSGRLVQANGADSCFGDGDRAVVVSEASGDGFIVTVGGSSFFTNAELDDRDAAVLATALLVPEGSRSHVAFLGPSIVQFGEETLGDLVPLRVTNAIVQLLAAFLIYALYRSRRLGKVVPEPVPVWIEGSELVLKSGLLSERAHDPTSAATIMRTDVMTRARRALSVPVGGGDQQLAERIAAHTGLEPDDVLLSLTSTVSTESELTQIARDLSEIDQRLYDESVLSEASLVPTKNES